jgi:hypothetical protein
MEGSGKMTFQREKVTLYFIRIDGDMKGNYDKVFSVVLGEFASASK